MKNLSPGYLLMIGSLAVLLAGCHKGEETRQTPSALEIVAVKVMTVSPSPVPATEEVIGTVRSETRAEAEAKVSGRIVELNVVPGQRVKAGDILARLEANEIEAQLRRAIAVHDQARTELARMARLLNEQAVTQQEFETARAQERVAQAAVDEAQSMTGYTTVSAPFDGVIVSKLADVGDLAGPGKPLLRIEDPTRLRLEAHVPEGIISHLKPGEEYSIKVDAISGPLVSTVSEIDPFADPVSRTSLVKFDLPGSPELRSGQFGRAAIPIDSQPSIFVPRSAVITRGQMEMVFVVTDRKADLRLVRTGRVSGDQVELISGIREGEMVVIAGVEGLADGQPVTISE